MQPRQLPGSMLIYRKVYLTKTYKFSDPLVSPVPMLSENISLQAQIQCMRHGQQEQSAAECIQGQLPGKLDP